MTGPRRVLIDTDYAADGIWWVSSREERESPISSYLTREHLQPWPLSQELLGELKAWNDSWQDSDGFWDSAEARRAWREQGRELAIRAQNEFGTDGHREADSAVPLVRPFAALANQLVCRA